MKKRLTVLILIGLLCFSSCAAPGQVPGKGGGIVLCGDEKVTLGDAERAAGKAFFDALFSGAVSAKSGGRALPAAEEKAKAFAARTEERLATHAEQSALPADEYLALIERLDRDRETLLRALYAEPRDEAGAARVFCAWYVALSDAFYKEQTAAFLFELLLDDYDRRIEDDLAHFEQYGYPYLAERAARLTGERALLVEQIGAEALEGIAGGWFLLCDLFLCRSEEDDILGIFTDEELRLMLLSPELPAPLSTDAWAMLIRRAAELDGDASLSSPEGARRLAGEMNALCSLIDGVRRSLSTEQIRRVRAGEQTAEAVLASCLSDDGADTLSRVRDALPAAGADGSVCAQIAARITDILHFYESEGTGA